MSLLDGEGFDVNDPQNQAPEGWFRVTIVESEVKDSASNESSSYIRLRFKPLDAQDDSIEFYHNITVANDNQMAMQIGRRELRSLLESIGLDKITEETVPALVDSCLDILVSNKREEGQVVRFAPEGSQAKGEDAA